MVSVNQGSQCFNKITRSLIARGDSYHFDAWDFSAHLISNGERFHGAMSFWHLEKGFFLYQRAGSYRNFAASLFGNHFAPLGFDDFLSIFANHFASGVRGLFNTMLLGHNAFVRGNHFAMFFANHFASGVRGLFNAMLGGHDAFLGGNHFALFFADHFASGVRGLFNAMLGGHDAFLGGNHFALFFANHFANCVRSLANLMFANHFAAFAGNRKVLYFRHHAASGEAYFLANSFGYDFAAIGANHIAIFLAYIIGASNGSSFHSGFPDLFADRSVRKLNWAAAYMACNINHLAAAWIHGPKTRMTNFSHHYLAWYFADFRSP